MQLDIAAWLCYSRSQLQVSEGAAGTADSGTGSGLSGTCLLPRPPASLGQGICQPRWGGSFLCFYQARGGEGVRFFCLNCHCFSSFLSGINYSGFVTLAGVSGNSDWTNPKNGIPF